MKRNLHIFILMFLAATCTTFCSKDSNPVPPAYVDFYIYLTLPSGSKLNAVGGYDYFTGGANGIVVYRRANDQFVAFDRTCTYQGAATCTAIVSMDKSGITLADACCGSTFRAYDGSVSKGPAAQSLRQYIATFSDATTVHITSY